MGRKARSAAVKKAAARDSFVNFAARLGVSAPGASGCEDNMLSAGRYTFNLVTRNRILLEAAYRGSWIVGKMIDTYAEDMTKAGITASTTEGAEQLDEFRAALSKLQIWKSIGSNIKWGKLYGGSLGVLQIKGQKLDTPLELKSIQKGQFLGIAVYDRWQLNPVLTEIINQGPDIGLPKFYDITLGSNLNDPGQAPQLNPGQAFSANPPRVHHSRVIRQVGIELPFFQAITEQMWGESVLERIWDRLITFDDATLSAASLINRAQLRTISVDKLREVIAAGGDAKEAMLEFFEMTRQFQSSEGMTLLDKEDVFTTDSYTFAGLSDILMQFGQQVSGGIDIPLVRLFGQSPAGLNATGDGDLKLYYHGINAQQESGLRNPVEMVVKILWQSLFGAPLPKDFNFTFTSLWQMTESDKATVGKANTDTIVAAHQEGLVDTPTAMKELKQTSGTTGLFSNITDEAIEEAENEEPPELEMDPSMVLPEPTADRAWTLEQKLRRFLKRA